MATSRAAQTPPARKPPSATYRVLVWGLVFFCISFALIGGVIAEQAMAALNCQYNANPTAGSCSFLQNALASRFAPFLSAETPLDYPFMLLHSFWGFILVWLVAIGFARHASHNLRSPAAAPASTIPTTVSPLQTLHATLQASFWILLVGLIAFCIAFGTPFLGTYVSREVLQALGCSPGGFDPLVSACMASPGFWTPRLQPFLLPFLGQLGSPLWLFWQFGDVLIIWVTMIAVVFVLKLYVAQHIAAKAP
ncbi:hypothetical protein [Polaromonas aquatica]|uniref:hypothetical protein n=1 Tax=Polaromonas aquatica TaxID=332657 RepID=UPI003D64B9C0